MDNELKPLGLKNFFRKNKLFVITTLLCSTLIPIILCYPHLKEFPKEIEHGIRMLSDPYSGIIVWPMFAVGVAAVFNVLRNAR